MLGNIARGCDPRSGKRINTDKDITLQEVLHKIFLMCEYLERTHSAIIILQSIATLTG